MSDQLTLGSLLREAGIRQVDRAYPEWADRARTAIETLAAQGGPFSADSVYDLAGPPPHPNCMGSAFRKASNDGVIEFVRFGQSERAPRHSGAQRIWRGKVPGMANPRPTTGGTLESPRQRTRE